MSGYNSCGTEARNSFLAAKVSNKQKLFFKRHLTAPSECWPK